MTLKERIQTDFILAFKAKETVKKDTLNLLKSKITETEKAKGNASLEDTEILKVIASCIKQRKQSIDEFTKGGRLDLVEVEQGELTVLESYLPTQMDETKIKEEITTMLHEFVGQTNIPKVRGQIMGKFNRLFTGMFDNLKLKNILEDMVK